MEQEIKNKHIRCSRLGAEDFPCARIVNCWFPYFNIEVFLKEKLMSEKWDNFINFQSQDKITSLIELMEQAKAKK